MFNSTIISIYKVLTQKMLKYHQKEEKCAFYQKTKTKKLNMYNLKGIRNYSQKFSLVEISSLNTKEKSFN